MFCIQASSAQPSRLGPFGATRGDRTLKFWFWRLWAAHSTGAIYGHAEGRSSIQSYKKAELVEGILNHIAFAHSAESPSETQQKALDWLPEAMAFPAVNPDGLSDVTDDDLPDSDDVQTDTAPDDADQDIEQDAQEIEVAIAA